MSGLNDDGMLRPLLGSFGLHAIIVILMLVSWQWRTEQKTMAPPAMMKAALVYAPKSTMPQQKTQTQKPEKPKPQPEPEPPKPEPPQPEPPKPEVAKPKETKPEIKPVDKPSPIVTKPEPPKSEPKKPEPKKQEPPKKPEPKKPEPKKTEPKKTEQQKKPDKVEPPKPTAKQADKKQDAKSAIEKEKLSKDAEMALNAMLNDEDITQQGELSDAQIGRFVGLIADRIAQNWNRPPNARQGMVVILAIELSPGGQLLSVSTVQSSGDRAFDLAAEAAVRKVETFKDIIDQMKPEEFKVFSKFNLEFDPQDLLM